MLFFFNGCNFQQNTDESESVTTYRSGTKGVEMKFMQNAPPSKIYDKESLDIMVEVMNKGAFDIVNGKLYLSGFDRKYLQISPSDTSFSIKGKSVYNPDGRLNEIITFSDSSVTLPKNTDNLKQNIKVTACYKYKTIAGATVCIDPVSRSVSEKVCQAGTVSMNGGQGGPVSVTSVEEEMGNNRVTFKINFANQGGGMVFNSHKSTSNCHTDLDFQDIDMIDLKVTLSDKTLTCEPNGGKKVKLLNNQGFVYCYYEGNLGDDAYLTQLQIEISYGYRNSITKAIEISKI